MFFVKIKFGEGIERRWTIEALFQSLKGRGFNLEETHFITPGSLDNCGMTNIIYLINHTKFT